jgi:hypothetical protein
VADSIRFAALRPKNTKYANLSQLQGGWRRKAIYPFIINVLHFLQRRMDYRHIDIGQSVPALEAYLAVHRRAKTPTSTRRCELIN